MMPDSGDCNQDNEDILQEDNSTNDEDFGDADEEDNDE